MENGLQVILCSVVIHVLTREVLLDADLDISRYVLYLFSW